LTGPEEIRRGQPQQTSQPADPLPTGRPAEFAALDRANGRDSPADYLKALALQVIAASP
jgi:hypothetical protein